MIEEITPPPRPETILTVIDKGARETMREARDLVAPLVQAETPHASGITAAALKPRIGRIGTGVSLTVGAPRGKPHGGDRVTIAQVVRYVSEGTGIYRTGPGPKHRIRAKNPLRRMTLPGGRKIWSVAGQHPNPFVERIQSAGTPLVQHTIEQGAERTAKAAERAI